MWRPKAQGVGTLENDTDTANAQDTSVHVCNSSLAAQYRNAFEVHELSFDSDIEHAHERHSHMDRGGKGKSVVGDLQMLNAEDISFVKRQRLEYQILSWILCQLLMFHCQFPSQFQSLNLYQFLILCQILLQRFYLFLILFQSLLLSLIQFQIPLPSPMYLYQFLLQTQFLMPVSNAPLLLLNSLISLSLYPPLIQFQELAHKVLAPQGNALCSVKELLITSL